MSGNRAVRCVSPRPDVRSIEAEMPLIVCRPIGLTFLASPRWRMDATCSEPSALPCGSAALQLRAGAAPGR